MKKIFHKILIVSLIFFIGDVNAQSSWEKFYSDYNNDLPITSQAITDIKYDSSNSSYVFLGLSHSARGWVSVYEVSNDGELIYRNYYGSASSGTHQNMQFTKDGGALISDYEGQGVVVIRNCIK